MSESITEIDKFNLDKEWEEQAPMYEKYAETLADAKELLARRKINVKVVMAEISQDIRNDPKKYGLSKPLREASVKDAIILSEEYQKAERLEIKAQHKVDLLNGLITALDHRKKALENLVSLDARSYFARPTVKGEVVEGNLKKKKLKNKIKIYKPKGE